MNDLNKSEKMVINNILVFFPFRLLCFMMYLSTPPSDFLAHGLCEFRSSRSQDIHFHFASAHERPLGCACSSEVNGGLGGSGYLARYFEQGQRQLHKELQSINPNSAVLAYITPFYIHHNLCINMKYINLLLPYIYCSSKSLFLDLLLGATYFSTVPNFAYICNLSQLLSVYIRISQYFQLIIMIKCVIIQNFVFHSTRGFYFIHRLLSMLILTSAQLTINFFVDIKNFNIYFQLIWWQIDIPLRHQQLQWNVDNICHSLTNQMLKTCSIPKTQNPQNLKSMVIFGIFVGVFGDRGVCRGWGELFRHQDPSSHPYRINKQCFW